MSRANETSRRFVVFLLAVCGVLTVFLVAPFVSLFAVAAVFAVSLFPLQEKLAHAFRGRRSASAFVISFGFVVVVLAPVVAVCVSLLKELLDIASEISRKVSEGGVEALIDSAPPFAREQLHAAMSRMAVDPSSVQSNIGSYSASAVRIVTAFLGGLGSGLLEATLMVIALTVFLIEGKNILAWISEHVPLRQKQTSEVFEELRKASYSVVVANIGTSLIQAAVALIGFLIAGATHLLVATFMTFIFAFIPGIGAGGTVVVVAAFLLLGGHTWQAIFLAAWGLIVVGLVDNIAKPLLMKRGVEMHGAIAFFAILAGIAAFGPIGIITGPMIVTFSLVIVKLYKRDFHPPMPGPIEPSLEPDTTPESDKGGEPDAKPAS